MHAANNSSVVHWRHQSETAGRRRRRSKWVRSGHRWRHWSCAQCS